MGRLTQLSGEREAGGTLPGRLYPCLAAVKRHNDVGMFSRILGRYSKEMKALMLQPSATLWRKTWYLTTRTLMKMSVSPGLLTL